MRYVILYVLFLSVAILPAGCSYSFTGANLGGMRNVAIPVFDNITSEPGIREKVTNQVTNGLIEDNTFKVTDRKIADAVILGKITKIEDAAFTFEGGGNNFSTTDYKITIYTSIRFENTKEKKVIWEEIITGWGRYSLSGSKNHVSGIEDAIRMITENILNKVIANW
jgi:hypothetical protein